MRNVLFALLLMLLGVGVRAAGLAGEKTVWLGNAAGERVAIGKLILTPVAADRWKFAFHLDEKLLGEYFLAMRPFRCLVGPRQAICHFPYGTRDEVTSEDWSALEYQLLFIHKPPAGLSLDARNGMFWKLKREGDRLVGTLWDADLDPIATPVGPRVDQPLTAEYLQRADPNSHWLPLLTIE